MHSSNPPHGSDPVRLEVLGRGVVERPPDVVTATRDGAREPGAVERPAGLRTAHLPGGGPQPRQRLARGSSQAIPSSALVRMAELGVTEAPSLARMSLAARIRVATSSAVMDELAPLLPAHNQDENARVIQVMPAWARASVWHDPDAHGGRSQKRPHRHCVVHHEILRIGTEQGSP